MRLIRDQAWGLQFSHSMGGDVGSWGGAGLSASFCWKAQFCGLGIMQGA